MTALVIGVIIVLVAVVLIESIDLLVRNTEYKKTAYYLITKEPYYSLRSNKGKYGEYLVYKHLETFETDGAKFLFNLYVPKGDGKTTEIDVLMICSRGIIVFESKNYSGWIFGSEFQDNWCQTLPQGRGRSHKEYFYNPVKQNRQHIKYLKMLLGEHIYMQSIIVFSNRCVLKNIKMKSDDIYVVNRHNVFAIVYDICNQADSNLLSNIDIDIIYNKLYPYTQVDADEKAQHIEDIHKNLESMLIHKTTHADSPERQSGLMQENTIDPSSIRIDANSVMETIEVGEEDKIEGAPIPNDEKSRVLKCPKCNGNLVLRTATKGANAGKQFYGCSNYPKCRYIQNIADTTKTLDTKQS